MTSRLTLMSLQALGPVSARTGIRLLLAGALLLTACSGNPDDVLAWEKAGTYLGEPVWLEPVGIFDQPVQTLSPPGDERLFVVERNGRVLIVRGGKQLKEPFLDVSRSISTEQEQGLFSLAFSPDFRTTGLVYASFTDRKGNNRIVEYRVDPSAPDRVVAASRRLILLVPQNSPIHNGGLIAFDAAGMLVAGIGDGGPDAPAQDGDTLLGKFVRIDPRPGTAGPYSIPGDNPFVSEPSMRPEIWAYGLRNPWRWSFDPETQDLFVADVGENDAEEINLVPPPLQAAANYGWPRLEGEVPFLADRQMDTSRLISPLLTYAHDSRTCAVVGGAVYRGPAVPLQGAYLYGDFCEGRIQGLRVEEGTVVENFRLDGYRIPQLVSFGEDAEGHMYVMSLDGPVYRLTVGARAAS